MLVVFSTEPSDAEVVDVVAGSGVVDVVASAVVEFVGDTDPKAAVV